MQQISVILPIYNVDKYINKCMESLLNQTYKNMEIILVDDGSTDSCGFLCDRYADIDSRIKVIHKKNGGLVSAWVRGIQESSPTSDFIAFIDPDDWVSEKYVEKLVGAQQKTGADVVAGPMTIVFPDYEIESLNYLQAKFYSKDLMDAEVYPNLLNVGDFDQRGIHMSRCSKLIKKQLILENLHYLDFKVTFCEDINTMFAVFLSAKSVVVLDDKECMYYYRQNPSSMLRSYDKNMLYSIESVHKSLFKICKEKNMMQMESQVYANYLVAAVQGYKNELQNPASFKELYGNIKSITDNEIFKWAISNINWRVYKRKINVLILYIMKYVDSILSKRLTKILRWFKQRRDKELIKASV